MYTESYSHYLICLDRRCGWGTILYNKVHKWAIPLYNSVEYGTKLYYASSSWFWHQTYWHTLLLFNKDINTWMKKTEILKTLSYMKFNLLQFCFITQFDKNTVTKHDLIMETWNIYTLTPYP